MASTGINNCVWIDDTEEVHGLNSLVHRDFKPILLRKEATESSPLLDPLSHLNKVSNKSSRRVPVGCGSKTLPFPCPFPDTKQSYATRCSGETRGVNTASSEFNMWSALPMDTGNNRSRSPPLVLIIDNEEVRGPPKQQHQQLRQPQFPRDVDETEATECLTRTMPSFPTPIQRKPVGRIQPQPQLVSSASSSSSSSDSPSAFNFLMPPSSSMSSPLSIWSSSSSSSEEDSCDTLLNAAASARRSTRTASPRPPPERSNNPPPPCSSPPHTPIATIPGIANPSAAHLPNYKRTPRKASNSMEPSYDAYSASTADYFEEDSTTHHHHFLHQQQQQQEEAVVRVGVFSTSLSWAPPSTTAAPSEEHQHQQQHILPGGGAMDDVERKRRAFKCEQELRDQLEKVLEARVLLHLFDGTQAFCLYPGMYDVLAVDVDFEYNGQPLPGWLRQLNPTTPIVGMMTEASARGVEQQQQQQQHTKQQQQQQQQELEQRHKQQELKQHVCWGGGGGFQQYRRRKQHQVPPPPPPAPVHSPTICRPLPSSPPPPPPLHPPLCQLATYWDCGEGYGGGGELLPFQ